MALLFYVLQSYILGINEAGDQLEINDAGDTLKL